MLDLSLSEIQEKLDKADLKVLPLLNLSILRNITLEPIEPYLRYFAYQMGFNTNVQFGEYDKVFQESVGGCERLLNDITDCILVFTNLETLTPDLTKKFNGLSSEQIETQVEHIENSILSVLQGIRKQSDAMILWHGFELPTYPSFGICDGRMENSQIGVIQDLNDYLSVTLQNHTNAYFVNMNLCLSRTGNRNYYDARYWHIGRALYSREALREIAFEDFKFIRAIKGQNKKCLVLDCDNTLWGGIIGEDGISGIKLSKSYPGSAYYEFQLEVMNLYNRGIILAICSKNNENDVWEIFEKHPDMALKREHIATAKINWEDKASNLRQIALDLNIGLNSIVFMDDSEFEVNLIAKELPEVEVILLPKDKSFEYRNILASCGLFDTLTVSTEDKNRGAMYKAEAIRKKLKVQSTDMDAYYRTLEMEVYICFATDFYIPRIAQQTQKTNQFNLTTRRYNESDIKRYVDAPKVDVLTIRVTDKFGDSGIVGTSILRYENKTAIIDTLLLSCRVLGRGIEDVFIQHILKQAKKKKCEIVVGEYFRSKRNGQVEFFYPKHGFKEIDPAGIKENRTSHYVLNRSIPDEPDYFKAIHSEIERGFENEG